MREVGYHARSGFCRVNGEDVLFIDHNTSPDLQVELLLSAIEGRDLSDLEVSDDVSRLIRGEKDVA